MTARFALSARRVRGGSWGYPRVHWPMHRSARADPRSTLQAEAETRQGERSTPRSLRKPAFRLIATSRKSTLRRSWLGNLRLLLAWWRRRLRILAWPRFAVGITRSWRLLRLLRPLAPDPWFASTRRRVL